jgi:putative CocE/NonD family hydrolase
MEGGMSQQILIERDVEATMRDGTVLCANVYRPNTQEPLPVLLTRLPYGKDLPLGTALLDPVKAAAAGYIVVVQDTRGRYRSGGEWTPFANEFEDGYDTVEWASKLPGSNGDVAMYGGSYFGETQWQAAVMRPPHLRALFPQITWTNYLNGTFRRGGAIEWGAMSSWHTISLLPESTVRSCAGDVARLRALLPQAVGLIDRLPVTGYDTLPLTDYARDVPELRSLIPSLFNMLEQPVDCELFHHLDVSRRFDAVSVPTYQLGGWNDLFLGETLKNYVEMRRRSAQAGPTRLLIAPWAHAVMTGVIGERDYGVASSGILINYMGDLTDVQLRWFDAVVKRKPNGLLDEDPVLLFVMGENRWRTFADWPVPGAREFVLYLDSAGSANTRFGDGQLGREVPSPENPADRYDYDPANPVRTAGGQHLLHGLYSRGAIDQRETEERPDVLCYSTPPLAEDITVVGPVTVRLYAASSAVDTDFVARLVDVFPDGRAYNLTDGIIRASYREVDFARPEATPPTLIEPGRAYAYDIDLWGTANTFKQGHRLRLEVTSSNFPRWDRNLNTGESGASSVSMSIAHQTILHDADHPSALRLWTVE